MEMIRKPLYKKNSGEQDTRLPLFFLLWQSKRQMLDLIWMEQLTVKRPFIRDGRCREHLANT